MSDRDGYGPIVGVIRDSDGLPAAGALVRAFAVRLRDEEPLGSEAATDADGRYSISTAPPDARDGAVRPNVRVAVFDKAGRELASSPVRFGVEGTRAIDLTLPKRSSQVSEFERYVAALAPVLQGMPLSDAKAADTAFFVGATGIPVPDLEGLVDASMRAATGEDRPTLPAEVWYGWFREGLPLEPAALWQLPTDELLDALRRAVDAGVVPARLGDDLDSIGARIEQLKLGPVLHNGHPKSRAPRQRGGGPRSGIDVPEEIRELSDVTIHVRETGPGFFEASLKPTDPLHISRNGYTLDTRRGLRGRTLTEVLDRAEANWRQNYPNS